jgi:hypothetical protein
VIEKDTEKALRLPFGLSVYSGLNADIGLKTTAQCEPIYEARGQRIVADAAEDGCTDRLPHHKSEGFVQTPHHTCRSSHTGLRLHAGTHVAYIPINGFAPHLLGRANRNH